MTSDSSLIPNHDDPLSLFEQWIEDAKKTEPNDYDAMGLATASPSGQPSLRMVLLKGYGPDGFVFYTNRDSRKGREIAANAEAALCFHWKTLRRQIRIEGALTEVGADMADAYFASRSQESRIAAWASDQSRAMTDRAEFEQRYAAEKARFAGQDVPRPPFWTGFCLAPRMIEFWRDMPHRMHDRLCYAKQTTTWTRERLYP